MKNFSKTSKHFQYLLIVMPQFLTMFYNCWIYAFIDMLPMHNKPVYVYALLLSNRVCLNLSSTVLIFSYLTIGFNFDSLFV